MSAPSARAVDYDCDDFASSREAQEYYNSHPGDPSDLDRDNDGYACDFGPPTGGTDEGPSPGRSADSGTDAEAIPWAVLVVVAVVAVGFFWTRSSPRTVAVSQPAEPVSEEPPARVLSSAPDPAYNLYIRLRNRPSSWERVDVVESYLDQAGVPREQILRSLLGIARQRHDASIADLASALLRPAEAPAPSTDPPFPEEPVAREAAKPGAEEPPRRSRSVKQRPGHLDPLWKPRRHHNEKAETSVRKLWEHHSGRELTGSRRREFLQRPELTELAAQVERNYDVVVSAAAKVVRDHPRGHLLLNDWLEAVHGAVRREEYKAASRREAAENRRRAATRKATSVMTCDSCGRAVGINGECGCS